MPDSKRDLGAREPRAIPPVELLAGKLAALESSIKVLYALRTHPQPLLKDAIEAAYHDMLNQQEIHPRV